MNLQKSLKYPVYSLKVTSLCDDNSLFHCFRLISVGCCSRLPIAPLGQQTSCVSCLFIVVHLCNILLSYFSVWLLSRISILGLLRLLLLLICLFCSCLFIWLLGCDSFLSSNVLLTECVG